MACKEHQRLLDDCQEATMTLRHLVSQLNGLIGTDLGPFKHCLHQCHDARRVCDDLRRDLDTHVTEHRCQQIGAN